MRSTLPHNFIKKSKFAEVSFGKDDGFVKQIEHSSNPNILVVVMHQFGNLPLAVAEGAAT